MSGQGRGAGVKGGPQRPMPGRCAEAKAPRDVGSTRWGLWANRGGPGGSRGSEGVQTHPDRSCVPSRFTPFHATGAGKSRRTGLMANVGGPGPAGVTPGLSCSQTPTFSPPVTSFREAPKSLSLTPASPHPSDAEWPTGRTCPSTQLVTRRLLDQPQAGDAQVTTPSSCPRLPWGG